MFGLSAFLAPFAAVTGSVPVITGINYDIIDIAGGGQRVVVHVDSSTGCTGMTIGGVACTGFAIDDATHVSGVPGARAAGTADVIVTNAAGPSNPLLGGTGMVEYWSPKQVATGSKDAYFDTDKGVTTVSGGKVSNWDSQGTTAYAFAQGTDASRPAQTASSFGAIPGLVLDGVDDVLIGAITGVETYSIFVVAKWTSTDDTSGSAFDVPLTITGSSGWGGFGASAGQVAWKNYDRSMVLRGAGLNDGSAHLIGVTCDSGAVKLWADGLQQGADFTPGNTSAYVTKIGSGRSGSPDVPGDFFAGTIGAVVILQGVISADNRTRLYEWAKQRFGVMGTSVTSISPTSGTERGGTSVTITGTGFTGATSASVGGLTLNSFTVVNDTTITGTTKMQVPGAKNVSVVNGTTATKSNAFTFNAVGKYTSGIPFRGINRPGPEYGEDWDGWNGQSWFEIPTGTPLTNEIAHFKSKGFNVIRLPFSWNRMQHTLNGALASTYSTNYKNLVTALTNAGFRVIVDCHNYVRYATSAWSGDTEIAGFTVRTLGDGTLTMAHLVDLWTKVAGLFVDNHYVQFGLMNEAHNFTLNNNTYYTGLNSIIAAIRGAGATSQLILVPNSDGSNVEHWSTWTGTTGGGDLDSVNALTITDSANNYAFDFHCYIDNPGSSTAFNTKLSELTTWLRTNGKKGYLTEGFSDKSSTYGSAAFGSLMSYLNTNNDVWIGITPWNLDPYEYTIQDGNGAHTIDGTCMSWYSPYLTSGIVT